MKMIVPVELYIRDLYRVYVECDENTTNDEAAALARQMALCGEVDHTMLSPEQEIEYDDISVSFVDDEAAWTEEEEQEMKARAYAMTNDEAINNILSLCENGTYHEWTVTDPDCLQMRRNLPSGEYQFIELWDCPSGGAIVVSSTIDLSDYSEGELWFYGSRYYENQSVFEAQGADIAAECVFEQCGDLADVLRTCETPESIVPTFLQILNSPAF